MWLPIAVAGLAVGTWFGGLLGGSLAMTAAVCFWASLRMARLGMVALPILLAVAIPYGIFPIVALVWYPDQLARENKALPLDVIPANELALFVCGALLAIAALGVAWAERHPAPAAGAAAPRRAHTEAQARTAQLLAVALGVVVGAIILATLISEFDRIAYRTEGVRQTESPLVAQALVWAPLLAVLLWSIGSRLTGRITTGWSLLAMALAAVTVVFTVRSGRQQPLNNLMIGLGAMALWPFLQAGARNVARIPWRHAVAGAFVLFFGFVALSNVNATRGEVGGEISPEVLDPGILGERLQFSEFVFQDWSVSALLIGLGQAEDYVDPGLVIRSNATTLPIVSSFVEHRTIGDVLSRRYDPLNLTGYADYVLREGYTFAGWPGIALSVALVLAVGIGYETFFRRRAVPPAVAAGFIGATAVLMVRSQTSASIRVFLLDVLVMTVLYVIATAGLHQEEAEPVVDAVPAGAHGT